MSKILVPTTGKDFVCVSPHGIKDVARYKTVLCKNWMRTGTCPWADKCQFAHDKWCDSFAAFHAIGLPINVEKIKSRVVRECAHTDDKCICGKHDLYDAISIPALKLEGIDFRRPFLHKGRIVVKVKKMLCMECA